MDRPSSKRYSTPNVARRSSECGAVALDDAIEARQKFMLAGNLDDETVSKKRQSAVDAAASVLDGFEKPLAALAVSITDVEGRMAAEQLVVDRRGSSEKLTSQTDAIESQLGPWLALTRELAASSAAVGPLHFEVDQIGRYLRNSASEVEVAIKLSVGNLRVSVAGILDGHRPIPAEPIVTVPVAEPVGPVLVQLFAMNALRNGMMSNCRRPPPRVLCGTERPHL